MKIFKEEHKKYRLWGITIFLSLSAVVVLSHLLSGVSIVFDFISAAFSALTSVWIGLIIAYLLWPVVRFFEEKLFIPLFCKITKKDKKSVAGVARGISVTLSILLILALIIGLLVMVIPQVVDSIAGLVHKKDGYAATLKNWIDGAAQKYPILDGVSDFLSNGVDNLKNWLTTKLLPSANILGTVANGVMSAAGIVVDFFVGLIISIYLLASKEKFLLQVKKVLAATFSKKTYGRILNAAAETHHVFGEFISGKLIDSLIVGIAMFVIMTIAGIPYAVLIAVVLSVANLIPFFGQFIGIIPTALLVFVEDPMKGLIYLILVVVYMQFDANVVSPKILGNSIGLGSFWILFSIILFGGLFGVVGMLIAVPVFAMIYRWCTRFTNKHLKKRGLPVEAFAYSGPSGGGGDSASTEKNDEDSETVEEVLEDVIEDVEDIITSDDEEDKK